VPAQAGDVKGGKGDVRLATSAKALEARMTFEPESIGKLDLFTKIVYVFVPGHRFFSFTQYHGPADKATGASREETISFPSLGM
jgi:hypothetical protein